MKFITMLKTVDRALSEGGTVFRLQEGREYEVANADAVHGLVSEGLAVYSGEKAQTKPANKMIRRAQENKGDVDTENSPDV